MSCTNDFVPQTQRHHSTRIVVMPLILIALSTVTGPLHAEEDIERLHSDPLSVSIATGNKKPLNLAPAVASVFTAQDIESVGARNLTEILAMVPGFHIGYSFDRYKPLYAVRGFSSANNQGVLVMIDGVPQTELLFGDRQHVIGTLPMTSIERVEVMRGPGSALYGADAYTAVVNVITKKQAPNTTSATVSSGTYDTRAAELLSGGTTGGVTSSASVSYSRSDGHEPVIAKDQQTNFDRLFRTNASLAPGRASTEREEIGGLANLSWGDSTVSLRTFKSDYGMGIGLASTLDPFGSVITTGVQTGYNYAKSLNQNLAFSAVINYSYLDYEMNNVHFFPPGAFRVFSDGVIFNEEHIERVIYSRIATEYTALDAHVLSSGIGGEIATLQQIQQSRNYNLDTNRSLTPTGTLQEITPSPKRQRNLVFVYLQDEWKVADDWTLTYGARYDQYSNYGSTTNPRVALVWNTQQNITTKLLYGRGFRVPSYVETEISVNPSIINNPELKPEALNTVEFAVDYQPQYTLNTRANIFYHKTDDQIFYRNTGRAFRPENIGNQTGHGLELELRWDITRDTKLQTFYAFQENTDETTGKDSGYSPHHRAFVMISYRFSDWMTNLKATYVGKRDRVATDSKPTPDTYTIFDLRLQYQIAKYLRVVMDVRNLFNSDGEEASFGSALPVDMPLPGRNYYLTLRTDF